MRKPRKAVRLGAFVAGSGAAIIAALVIPAAASAATFNVSTAAALTAAITSINNEPTSNDTVNLAAGTYTPTSLMDIGAPGTNSPAIHNVTFVGTGQVRIVGSATVDSLGNPADVIHVEPGNSLTVQNVSFTTGQSGLNVFDVFGSLTLVRSSLTANSGQGIVVEGGGQLTLSSSTVGGNSGFGIIDTGIAAVSNSTIANNLGGIDNSNGVLKLTNSILANNGAAPTFGNCQRSADVVDRSLSSDATCGVTPSLQNKNPLLGALGNNGGTTAGYPLTAGSPAIGAGDSSAFPQVDQRNTPYGAARDLGSEASTTGTLQTNITWGTTPPSFPLVNTNWTPSPQVATGPAASLTLDANSLPGSCYITGPLVIFANSAGYDCIVDAVSGGSFLTSGPITISQLSPQAINWTDPFPTPPTQVAPFQSFPLTATATSGLPVVFSLDPTSAPGTCTISGPVGSQVATTHNAAGTCVIDANQIGSSTFAPAPTVQQVASVS
jgi:hypothetical protein